MCSYPRPPESSSSPPASPTPLSAQIPVVTLDHYWKNVLGSKQVAFVKIDVEGHEYQVGEHSRGGGQRGRGMSTRWEGTAGSQGHGEEMGSTMARAETAVTRRPILSANTSFPRPPPPQVLEGAKEMMKAAPPAYVLIEFYPFMLNIKKVTIASYLKLIASYGYRIYDCQQKVRAEISLPAPRGLPSYGCQRIKGV